MHRSCNTRYLFRRLLACAAQPPFTASRACPQHFDVVALSLAAR
jgi:hypothetical protein